MIVKVVYGKKTKEGCGIAVADEMMVVSQIIDCARLYPMENETHWGFMAYDENDTLITKHEFDLSDKTKAYITDRGKTVDVLPRK